MTLHLISEKLLGLEKQKWRTNKLSPTEATDKYGFVQIPQSQSLLPQGVYLAKR